MTDVLVIVPQAVEYKAVHEVLKTTGKTPARDAEIGLFTVADKDAEFTVAVAYLDTMYNLPSLSKTAQLLQRYSPHYAFLVGSACGNPSKVAACDVVLSAPNVVYLGAGRLVDGGRVEPRHFTYAVRISQRIADFHQFRMARYRAWSKRFTWIVKKVAESVPGINPDLVQRSDVKHGVIGSDDYVLEFSDSDSARTYWRKCRDDVSAYDMESAGFAYACNSHEGGVEWAVIRGVSDHGIKNEAKGHLEAATVAAVCLESFLKFLLRGPAPSAPDAFNPCTYDWHGLFGLLENQQRRFRAVYKGQFIKQILRGRELDLSALAFAISRGAVHEYEFTSAPDRRSRSVIRLDKDPARWASYLSASRVAWPPKGG